MKEILERTLHHAIVFKMDNDGCSPTQEELGEIIGRSKSTVNGYLRELFERGLVDFTAAGRIMVSGGYRRNYETSRDKFVMETIWLLGRDLKDNERLPALQHFRAMNTPEECAGVFEL